MALRKDKQPVDLSGAEKRLKAKRAKAAKKAAVEKEKKSHSVAWNKSKKLKVSPRQAQKSRDALKRVNREKAGLTKVQIPLQTFHIIGSIAYGPGTVWVPKGLVLTLLEMDRRAQEAESALFSQGSHIIVSAGRGSAVRPMPVATSNFEQVWAGVNPPIFDQVSGRGMADGEGARF